MNDDAPPLISAHGLQRTFDGGERQSLTFAPFTLPRGGLIAVIGRSGVGKTTLINMLAGVDQPEFGTGGGALTLRFADGAGAVLTRPGDPYPRARVSNIFQRGHLLGNVAIGMNVAVPMALAGRQPRDAIVEDMLGTVDLTERDTPGLMARRPWQISGGQAQRVGIARALARDPEVIFADEPTSNLDEDARDRMMARLEMWLDDPGHTLILVSHDLDLIERHAARVFVLHRGADGGPSVLREHLGARDADTLGRAMDTEIAAPPASRPVAADGAPAGIAPVPVHPEIARTRVALKLALSELFARRGYQRRTGDPAGAPHAWQTRLQEATASWDKTRRLPDLAWLLHAYSQRNTWAVSVLILILAAVTTVAVKASAERWDGVLTDPSNCGVLAEGARGQAEPATRDVVARYAARPWNEAMRAETRASAPGRAVTERRPRAGCAAGPGAFGRYDGYGARIGVLTEAGRCSRRYAVAVLPLITEINDPILATSRLLDGAAQGRTIQDVYRDPVSQGRARQVFVTRDFLDFMSRKLNAGDVTVAIPGPGGELCLSFPGTDRTVFTLAGVVDRLPAPRIAPYQAFVPVTDYQGLLPDGEDRAFTRVKFYFDTGGFWTPDRSAELEAFLADRHYSLIGDALAQSRALRSEARNALILQVSVGLVIAALFFAVVYQITLSYFERNAAQFAVLRTFGMTRGLMVLQSLFTMAYTLAFALALNVVLVILPVALLGPFPLGESLTIGLSEAALGVGIAFLAAAAISVVSAASATRTWWAKDRLLSEMIG